MKKLLIFISSLIILNSCGSKEEEDNGGLSRSQIENLEETSLMNSEKINYEGTFKGKIKGKEVIMKLEDDTFEITENGKKAYGKWSKLDDGASIELEPKSGSVSTKYFGYSDNDTWVALTNEATYPENEEYLKRIDD